MVAETGIPKSGLQRDLLGRLVLVRRWGRLGAAGWQGCQTRLVDSDREAGRLIRDTLNRRRRHGYCIVEVGNVYPH